MKTANLIAILSIVLLLTGCIQKDVSVSEGNEMSKNLSVKLGETFYPKNNQEELKILSNIFKIDIQNHHI